MPNIESFGVCLAIALRADSSAEKIVFYDLRFLVFELKLQK